MTIDIDWVGVIVGGGVAAVLTWSRMKRPVELGLGGTGSFSRHELLLREAHKHSFKNRSEIEKSTLCGCFYCEKNFTPKEIQGWIDDEQTAMCPFCGIDSVLGNYSGFYVTQVFLHTMSERWFAS